MKVLWIARYNNRYNEISGGREMIGYCGWHTTATEAFNEAKNRYPDIEPNTMAINQA